MTTQGRNEKAVRATLRRLEVSPTNDAVGSLAISLAICIDEGAGMAMAAVSRELRAALSQLEARTGGIEDDFDKLLAELSPKVGNTKD
jgi:hypothetical protein